MTKQETAKLLALALANWPSIQDKGMKIEVTAALWHKMLETFTFCPGGSRTSQSLYDCQILSHYC